MLPRLILYYWRESCNIRTAALLVVVILLTVFGQNIAWVDDKGELEIYETLAVSIVDYDKSIISYVIRTQFSDLDAVETVYLDDYETAKARLERNEVVLVLVLPENFYENTISVQQREHVLVYLNEQMPAEANLFAKLLNHAVDSFTSVQATLYTYQEELRPLINDVEKYEQYSSAATLDVAFRMIRRNSMLTVEHEAKMRQFWFVIAALTSIFGMLPALLVLMMVQQEIQSGQQERLRAANVPWWQLHLAKMIIGMIWLLTGLVPMFLFARFYLPQLSWLMIITAVLPLYLSSSLLCLSLAYRSRRTETVMLTAWLGMLAFLLLAGGIYPRQLLPEWLLPLQPVSPAYWSFNQIYDLLYERDIAASMYIWPLIIVLICIPMSWFSWKKVK